MMRVRQQEKFFANFSVEKADSAGVARMSIRHDSSCAPLGELAIR